MSIENIIQIIIDAKEEIPIEVARGRFARIERRVDVNSLDDWLIDIREKLDDVVDALRELERT